MPRAWCGRSWFVAVHEIVELGLPLEEVLSCGPSGFFLQFQALMAAACCVEVGDEVARVSTRSVETA